uniref:(northern house mosquito) hypothetical protein n=1 Tax=Culex pipiens TaxID=7175 RepID=A0A8D8D6V4_CULPI
MAVPLVHGGRAGRPAKLLSVRARQRRFQPEHRGERSAWASPSGRSRNLPERRRFQDIHGELRFRRHDEAARRRRARSPGVGRWSACHRRVPLEHNGVPGTT